MPTGKFNTSYKKKRIKCNECGKEYKILLDFDKETMKKIFEEFKEKHKHENKI